MKKNLLPLFFLLFTIPVQAYPPNDPQGIEVYFHASTRDTFYMNEKFFARLVIKNQTSHPVYFSIRAAKYDEIGQYVRGDEPFVSEGIVNFLENEFYKPYKFDLTNCMGGGWPVVRVNDSLVHLVHVGTGCLYGNSPSNKLKLNTKYKVKIMVNFQDGTYKILEKNLYLKEKDEEGFVPVDRYFNQAAQVKKTNKEEYQKYKSREYLYPFFDTCHSESAKEDMMASIMSLARPYYQLKDESDVKFLKKYILPLQNEDLLMYALDIVVSQTTGEYSKQIAGSGINRQELYKEIMRSLKHRDKLLGYIWLGQLIAWNHEAEKFKKCNSAFWGPNYYLSELELDELETMLRSK